MSLKDRIASLPQEKQELFGEVIVPEETTVESRKGGERRQTKRKFFPGYMLVQMELQEDTWHLVKGTPKVSGFVGGTKNPLETPAMSELEVERILGKMSKSVEKSEAEIVYEVHDQVRVLDGPFQNFLGTVESVDKDKSRLCVSVSILGRVVPVELEFSQVEKVDAK